MHRDAGEEEDGAVEVEVEQKPNKAAHEVPKHPAVSQHVARHQERQRKTIHQVSRGQVNHVDERGIPTPPAATAANHATATTAVVAAGAQQYD